MVKTFLLIFLILFSIGCSDNSKPSKLLVNLEFQDSDHNNTLAQNSDYQLNVNAIYNDGTKENINSSLKWSSSDESIATISDSGILSIKDINATSTVEIFYQTKEKAKDLTPLFQGSHLFYVKYSKILSLTLKPNTQQYLNIGEKLSIKVMAHYENNVTGDITSKCIWSSDNSSIVKVDTSGTIEALKKGNTTIIAISKSFTDINSTISINVVKNSYTKLEIRSDKTNFNKSQTIQLELYGITDTNDTILITNSDSIKWSSTDTTKIKIEKGLATALEKGSSTIKASLVLENNSTITDTIDLNVIKDKYLRIWQNKKELDFSYYTERYEALSESDTFTIKAIGESRKITTLDIRDQNGSTINTGASFATLSEGDTIDKDTNLTFSLKRTDSSLKWIQFYFQVDDQAESEFNVKYIDQN